jgi:hypothetical protein
MDHESGRLVNRKEVTVLVEDRQRDVLGLERRRARLGHFDRDFFAGANHVRAARGHGSHENAALIDEFLDPRTGQIRAHPGEEDVEPRARGRRTDLKPPLHGAED